MGWKEQLDKAISAIKDAAESEKAQEVATKAKVAAASLAQQAKEGVLGAAEAFVEANTDPSALKIHYLNADVTVVSPSDGISITRTDAATLVVSDGAGNGLVINAAADTPFAVGNIGEVKQLSSSTFDLGTEDGENVIVLKT